MSDSQVKYFVDLLKQIEMPTSLQITEEGRELFERGCDVMLMYRGHPDTLMQALKIFLATDIRPYAFAGAAKIIDAAAYISGGKYDAEGNRIALEWLSEAQEIAPHRFEINVIEPGIYGNLKDTTAMRSQLDVLRMHPEAKTSFRYAIVEMWYWDKKNDHRNMIQWNETAFNHAQNNIQRLFALNTLAGSYLTKKQHREALGLYHEVVKIDSSDPWAWHNMSIIYMQHGDYANAGVCNDRALRNMDFEAARQVQRSLIKQWSKDRRPDLLTEIPPYKIATKARPESNRFLRHRNKR